MEYTLAQLAEAFDCEVHGDPHTRVDHVSTLQNAGPGAISFLANPKYKKFLGVKNNKFFNALQVKFSYAITCHKSQGGQWDTVFVEQPYLPNGVDREYLRWLYTAVTRAQRQLYLIGFKDDFFLD